MQMLATQHISLRADASPFPHHHGQARPSRATRVRIGVTHRTAAEVSSSVGLLDGWSNTIWRVCTPRENTSSPFDIPRVGVHVSGTGWMGES
jgi:hypothetical protein